MIRSTVEVMCSDPGWIGDPRPPRKRTTPDKI
jgi:hypothetical protein